MMTLLRKTRSAGDAQAQVAADADATNGPQNLRPRTRKCYPRLRSSPQHMPVPRERARAAVRPVEAAAVGSMNEKKPIRCQCLRRPCLVVVCAGAGAGLLLSGSSKSRSRCLWLQWAERFVRGAVDATLSMIAQWLCQVQAAIKVQSAAALLGVCEACGAEFVPVRSTWGRRCHVAAWFRVMARPPLGRRSNFALKVGLWQVVVAVVSEVQGPVFRGKSQGGVS